MMVNLQHNMNAIVRENCKEKRRKDFRRGERPKLI